MADEMIVYRASLIGQKFHASEAFVRGVKGPVGSGKSVMMCMEIINKALNQQTGPDGKARSRWAVIRNCFDEDTEILTKNLGWVRFADLPKGEPVATLHGDELRYDVPFDYYEAEYDGELMGFEGEGIDFLVTPNHRQWASKIRTRKKIWGDYEFFRTEDIFGKTGYRVRRWSNWAGEPTEFTVDQFEWLGFWFAEGSIGEYKYEQRGNSPARRFSISQLQDEGREYTVELFEKAGIPWNVAHEGTLFYVSLTTDLANRLFELLKDCGTQTIRYVPNELKSASPEHLRAFINGFIAGDGHHRKDAVTRVAYTSSKQLADDLQEMALKAGLVANITVRDRIGKELDFDGVKSQINAKEYTVTFVSETKYEPLLQKAWEGRVTTQYKGWYKQPYNKKVYCVRVPSEVICVRRNGKNLYVSNSYPELKSTTIETWKQWAKETIFGKVKYDTPIIHRLQLSDTHELEVLFLALDRPDDVKKLLSLELTGVWVNEAVFVPKAIIDAATGRVGRYPSKRDGGTNWSGIILDTNPPDDDHWWYAAAEEHAWRRDPITQELKALEAIPVKQRWEFFAQPSGLSPDAENVQNLPEYYYERLMAGKPSEWVRVFVHGEYGCVADGKPVFPEFRESTHVADQDLKAVEDLPIFVGMDYGLTPAAVFGQRLYDGRWQIVHELVCFDMGIVRFTELLKKEISSRFPNHDFEFFGDPAGDYRSQTDEATPFIVQRNMGIPVVPAHTNDFVIRREAVASVLNRMVDGKPGFLISPHCTWLRKALAGRYRYRRLQVSGSDAKYNDKPEKNEWSHVADSCQYLFLGGGEGLDLLRRKKKKKEAKTSHKPSWKTV